MRSKNPKNLKKHFPPGPASGILGLSFLNRFKADPLATAAALKQECGDFVHVKAGPYDWFMFNHPDQVKDIFVTRGKLFGKTEIFKRVLSSVDGNGLVISEGEFWLKQRRIMQPGFAHEGLTDYSSIMHDEIEKYLINWHPGSTIDLSEEMTRLTLTIAARAFFNADVGSMTEELGNAVTTISQAMLHEFFEFLPVPEWIPLPGKTAKRKAVATIDRLIETSIIEHRQNDLQGKDLMAMLLRAQAEGNAMTDKQVRDEAITLFNAGHDSTAAALAWAWYLLLRNRNTYEELLSLANESSIEQAQENALRIAKETIRLYPPAWTLPRQSLDDTEVAGFTVPRGSLLNFFPYLMHRDERFFESPEKFKPERFHPEAETKLHPFSYFPFGAGPRACIGKDFALKEMSLVLTMISQRFRLEPIDLKEIEPLPLISLEPSAPVMARVLSK